jgi:hypothetical protein
MNYNPDRWLVVKLTDTVNSISHYRVFATWRGGYLNGDSWRMNSGIASVTFEDDYYNFVGSSGSIYCCHKGYYGSTIYGESVLQSISKSSDGKFTIDVMPDDTDFLKLEYK